MMAGNKKRRSFLTTTLQILRNTFRKHLSCKFRRTSFSDGTFTMQSRSASISARKDSVISSYDSQSSRSTHNISTPRHRSPLYALDNRDYENNHEHEQKPECEHEENIPNSSHVTRGFRIRRFASRLNRLDVVPRTHASVEPNSKPIAGSSRVPTPNLLPENDLYSHSVYLKEGRSVLSCLGRRGTVESREKHKMSESRTSMPTLQGNITSQHQDRQFVVNRAQSVHGYNGRESTPAEMRVSAPAPAPIRKERRVSGNYSSNSNSDRLSSLEAPSAATTRNTMALPRRTRLSKGFEDFKMQSPQQTKLPIPVQNPNSSLAGETNQIQKTQLQTQTHEQAKENNSPKAYRMNLQHPTALAPVDADGNRATPKGANELGSKLPLASSSITRRRVQIEKMVPTPLPPTVPPHTVTIPGRAPSRVFNPKTRTKLTPQFNDRPQVETAMPQAYWLGRFMTLTNAFQYEDSFNEPDIATGFEMPSSYSRPFQRSHDGDLAGYRVKRTFMVLENVCATEEASASLREFRDEYICQFGDSWMA